MNFILETVKKILLESRVDDAKKKFPNLDPAIIDYFVAVDPSGNNKYLEWMCKAMSHKPTTWGIGDRINNHEYEEGIWGETAGYLSKLVTKFHELLPYLVHPNEKGEKEGTTDLYLYKFTDSEMIHYLIYDLEQAQERRDIKETQKRLIKGADKLLENSEWLVIRPKTHESSCHYGAGTKWCTTMKNTSSHFVRETDRTFLIYVINKKKPITDPTGKVAWQIPYYKDNSWIIDPKAGSNKNNFVKRIKLWNAEDDNIAPGRMGEEYYDDNVPMYIKEVIFKYVQKDVDEMFSKTGFSEDERVQAIVEYFGYTPEDIDSIEEVSDTNYGLKVYYVGTQGDAYAVANTDELNNARREWAEMYVDSEGVENIITYQSNPSRFIEIRDKETIANELASGYMDDMSDEDILDSASHIRSIKPYTEEYEALIEKKESLEEEEMEYLTRHDDEIGIEDYEKEVERLGTELKVIEKDVSNLFEKIKEKLEEDVYDNYLSEMSDTMSWLRDWGWTDREGRISPDAINRGVIDIDESALIHDYYDDTDANTLSSTGHSYEIRIDGTYYYIIPTDI